MGEARVDSAAAAESLSPSTTQPRSSASASPEPPAESPEPQPARRRTKEIKRTTTSGNLDFTQYALFVQSDDKAFDEERVKGKHSLEQVYEEPKVDWTDFLAVDRVLQSLSAQGISTSLEVQVHALMAMRHAARYHPNHVLSKGHLGPALAALFTPNRSLRAAGAGVLCALCIHKAGQHALMAHSREVVPRLIAMLRAGAASMDAHYAALTIANWALHYPVKDLVGRAGGLPVLVALLKQCIRKPVSAERMQLRKLQAHLPPPAAPSQGEAAGVKAREARSPAGPESADLSSNSDEDEEDNPRRGAPEVVTQVPDDLLTMVEALPAGVHAATALLNLVGHSNNERILLRIGLPDVVASALCCPAHNQVTERCRLLATWLSVCDLRALVLRQHTRASAQRRAAKLIPAGSASSLHTAVPTTQEELANSADQPGDLWLDEEDQDALSLGIIREVSGQEVEIAVMLGQVLRSDPEEQRALERKLHKRRWRVARQVMQAPQHMQQRAPQHSAEQRMSIAGITEQLVPSLRRQTTSQSSHSPRTFSKVISMVQAQAQPATPAAGTDAAQAAGPRLGSKGSVRGSLQRSR